MKSKKINSKKVNKKYNNYKSIHEKSLIDKKIKDTVLQKVDQIKGLDGELSQESFFTGTYIKHGRLKRELNDRTVLLVDIRNEKNEFLSDHVWLMNSFGFEKLDLVKGDQVQFKATLVPSSKKVFLERKEIGAYMHYDFRNIQSVRVVHNKEFMINK